MAKNEQRKLISATKFVELNILRLAALAVDLRGQLTPRAATRTPSLVTVLDACDLLFEEMGWGRPNVSLSTAGIALPQRDDSPLVVTQLKVTPRVGKTND